MATSGNRIALGLDVGGTRIKAVALNEAHAIVNKYEGPSEAQHGPEAVREAIQLAVSHFEKAAVSFDVIGVGCAGSVAPVTGVVRNSPNFADWKNVPLKAWLETDYDVPVTVDNDANCAVYAEWIMGNAKGKRNVVLLTLGTGIGGGLILNNQLFRGATGTGGEIGHFTIYADGKWCPCGNRGCFERYCSATALREAGGISAREVFARSDEDFFKGIITHYLRDFQAGLTSLANIFDPDCILLGGAVTQGLMPHLSMLEAWIKKHAFPAVSDHMQLGIAKYGNLSGSLGAALIALLDQGSTS